MNNKITINKSESFTGLPVNNCENMCVEIEMQVPVLLSFFIRFPIIAGSSMLINVYFLVLAVFSLCALGEIGHDNENSPKLVSWRVLEGTIRLIQCLYL